MTEFVVVYWTPSDKVFNYEVFNSENEAFEFARRKKKKGLHDVIVVKNIDGKYHLLDFGYSTIFIWQNRILNFLSFMLIAIISYLYYKFVHNK
jgi:hypothetical protein